MRKAWLPTLLMTVAFLIGSSIPLWADCCCPNNEAEDFSRISVICDMGGGCSEQNPWCVTESCCPTGDPFTRREFVSARISSVAA